MRRNPGYQRRPRTLLSHTEISAALRTVPAAFLPPLSSCVPRCRPGSTARGWNQGQIPRRSWRSVSALRPEAAAPAPGPAAGLRSGTTGTAASRKCSARTRTPPRHPARYTPHRRSCSTASPASVPAASVPLSIACSPDSFVLSCNRPFLLIDRM